MIDFSNFDNLVSLLSYFSSEKKCKQALAEQRWADGVVVCPICGCMHCVKRKDGRYRCTDCGRNFSVLVGTIFENTKISLTKWFAAMYLISSHRKGISSAQLARDIHVTQKTAWLILQKVRTLYAQDTEMIEGDVEMDEAYIGGCDKWKHDSKKVEGNQGRSTKTKTPVFGMIQRDGKVIAGAVKDTKANTLSGIIRQFVKPGSRIFTDEYIGYKSLTASEYVHGVVFHSEKKFVDGEAHTNSIEGFWSQLKRSIFGIYHFVSAKYLQSYVNESVFRYNTRKWSESMRFADMFSRSVGVVRYWDIAEWAA